MPIDIQRVQPGDLITSAFVNSLIGHLEALDTRLLALEGSTRPAAGAVVITTVTPTPVRVGQDLTVVGENFGVYIGAHRILLDGVSPSVVRPGSTDRVLVLPVPELRDLPDLGRAVTLLVSNATSSATRTITVLPAQTRPEGDVDVALRDTSPDPLAAGRDNPFRFSLRSDATVALTMTLDPVLLGADGALLPWPVTVRGADGQSLPQRQVPLPRGASTEVVVVVTVPADAASARFTLELAARGGGIAASTGPLDFRVGEQADPTPDVVQLSPATTAGVVGTTITGPVGTLRNVSVEADLATAGTYLVTLEALPGLTGWQQRLTSPPANAPRIEVAASDLDAGGVAHRVIQFRVRADEGATTGQLRLAVRRDAPEARARALTFQLRTAP